MPTTAASLRREIARLRGRVEATTPAASVPVTLSAIDVMTRALGGSAPDPWQAGVLTSTAPQALLLCNRQAGKSTTSASLAVHTAIAQENALVLLVSPSQRQSSELFKKVMTCYRASGRPVAPLYATQTALQLVNGSRVVSLPGNEETIRGFSGVTLLIIDEASRVPDELYYAVRPMLAVSGGRLLGLTTPWGKRGWFYQEWEHGQEWERVKATAYECTRISREFLERERATMPDPWFRSEYLCEFTDTEDAIFTMDQIQAAATGGIAPLSFD